MVAPMGRKRALQGAGAWLWLLVFASLAGAQSEEAPRAGRIPPRVLATPEELRSAERLRPSRVLATHSEMDAAHPRQGEDNWRWALLPSLAYNRDQGIGGSLFVGLLHEDGELEGHRDRIHLLVSGMSSGAMFHQLQWQRRHLGDAPVNLELAFTFRSAPWEHYCGLGSGVTCGANEANEAAMAVAEEQRGDFLEAYYRLRSMRGGLRAKLSWRPIDTGPVYAFGWRGQYHVPGAPGRPGNRRGSRYDRELPDGERGWLSEAELSLRLDRRDSPLRPHHGYDLGVSLRGAIEPLGRWSYGGGTAFFAGYLGYLDRFVWANRLIAEVIAGDAPTWVLGAVGGDVAARAYGGVRLGRGMRQQRYRGAIKVIAQSEVRATILQSEAGVGLALQAFVDAAWIGESLSEPGPWDRLLVGFGGGIGMGLGNNILRLDVAFSAHENYKPHFYFSVAHPY